MKSREKNYMFFKKSFLRKRNAKFVFFLFIVMFLLICENYLIFIGYPLSDRFSVKKYWIHNKSLEHKYDYASGWTLMHSSVRSNEDPNVGENIGMHGGRISRKVVGESPQNLVMIFGCSYTYGMGVEDCYTYPWRLHGFFETRIFDNYAVPAYGTHQCYARMLQLSKTPWTEGCDTIIYAFMDEHIARNTRYTVRREGKNDVISPVSVMAENELRYYSPYIIDWPLMDKFRLVNFFKNIYLRSILNTERSAQYQKRVFNEYLLAMNKIAENLNARFAVAFLESPSSDFLYDSVRNKIGVIEAGFPATSEARYRVSGWGHPNAEVHCHWAECIASWLKENRPIKNKLPKE